MENNNRLVIDAIKKAFSQYVSTGEVDANMLSEVQNKLNFELDRLKVDNLPTEEIEALKEDISWVKYDLLEL